MIVNAGKAAGIKFVFRVNDFQYVEAASHNT